MRPARSPMHAVDLVEVDDPVAGDRLAVGGAAEVGGDPATASPRPRRRGRPGPGRGWRAPRWGLVVAVVAALAVTGVAVVGERGEAARLRELGRLPGVLRPVEGPLTTAWTSDQRLSSRLWQVGGLVVGVRDVWDGTRDVAVVALDAGTGRTVWRTTVLPSVTPPTGGVRCVVPDAPAGGGDADRVVTCLSIDRLGPDPQDLSRFRPRHARLLVLDAATGEVLEERPVDPTTSVDALGPDLVLRDVLDDGRVRVTRTGPRGRDVRWTVTGEPTTSPPEHASVRTDGDLVVVPGEAGWVLSARGDVVHSWPARRPAASGSAAVLRGRVLVQPRRDLVGSTQVVDLRSGRAFTTDGYVPALTVDDGSTGDLVLVQSARGDGLLAQRLGSGRTRWSAAGGDAGGVLVVDGRVVRATSRALGAVDARTGAPLWSVPSVPARQYGLHTDGRVVVRTERDDDRGVVLVARGLDDGRLHWTTDVTDGLERLVELGGRLVGVTSDGTVAFGPAG